MRKKVRGRLMQARFIEIHQIFAKQKVGYFSNGVLCTNSYMCVCFIVHLQISKFHSLIIGSWAQFPVLTRAFFFWYIYIITYILEIKYSSLMGVPTVEVSYTSVTAGADVYVETCGGIGEGE